VLGGDTLLQVLGVSLQKLKLGREDCLSSIMKVCLLVTVENQETSRDVVDEQGVPLYFGRRCEVWWSRPGTARGHWREGWSENHQLQKCVTRSHRG